MNLVKPKHFSEANTQAEIYHQCKNLGIDCYLEFTHDNCRFDIVIVKSNRIIGIVEVKQAHHIATKKALKRQREKYSRFGLPIHFCFCLGDIPHTMKVIQGWIEKPIIVQRVEQRRETATYGMTKY